MIKLEYLSYDQMNGYYLETLRGMSNAQYIPDVIIGVSRGGLDMAVKLSQWFEVPMVSLVWQTRDGGNREEIKLEEILLMWKNKNILIVDDFLDSGKTIDEITNMAHGLNILVDVAVAVANTDADVEATWRGRDLSRANEPQWLVFPWEEWWRTV